jgi:hypothetical protein
VPIEIALWRLDTNKGVPVPSSSLDAEKRLEEVLENDIGVLGLDRLLLIGRQVPTRFGKFIDLLALGPSGDLYVVELKRDRTPREVVAQALDYGSWVRELGYDDIAAIFSDYTHGDDFDTAQQTTFGEVPDELNASHNLVIVASELDSSTERILDYLNEFEVPINVVFFRYFRDDEREYLGRSWLVDPAQAESRAGPQRNRKKRPWNGKDFYISFGDGDFRNWEDARRYGFVSGGGKKWYWQSLSALQPGHRVFVHIPQHGYVGVGLVTESVQTVDNFEVDTPSGRRLILGAPDLKAPDMGHNADNPDMWERVVRVKWIDSRPIGEAFWEPGFFANQNTAAKFRNAPTLERLKEHFNITDEDD